VLGRSGLHTPEVLPQTLRYFADTIVVVAVAIALVIDSPRGAVRPAHRPPNAGVLRWAGLGAVVLFLVASVWSTADHVRTWSSDSTTPDYMATARASLAVTDAKTLLDQEVPEGVLWPLARPMNRQSFIFAPLEARPDFGPTAPDLRVLDRSGHIVQATLNPQRSIAPGPNPDCGYFVGDSMTTVQLDGPMYSWAWTVQLNYVAEADGSLDVAFEDGTFLRTPVKEGPNSVFLNLVGGGSYLRMKSDTSERPVCVDTGLVGFVDTPTD
jgi:hypothetical protein